MCLHYNEGYLVVLRRLPGVGAFVFYGDEHYDAPVRVVIVPTSNSLELHALLVGVKAPVYRALVNENRRSSSPVVTQHIRLIVLRTQHVRWLDF